MWKNLARLFVANDCLACGQMLTTQERHVCLQCLSQMEETYFHDKPADNELYFRLAGKVPLSGAASLFYFDKGGRLQRVIKQLKYQSIPQVGNYLGEYYANRIKASGMLAGAEAIVPVPLHPRKQRKRGYNQAERIARGLGRGLNLPVRTDVLKRVRYTESQARKDGQDRWKNVEEAFRVVKPLPKGIILVDDIITLGATMGACLKALHQAEQTAEHIYALSLGLTRKD
jgi:ComF family protein